MHKLIYEFQKENAFLFMIIYIQDIKIEYFLMSFQLFMSFTFKWVHNWLMKKSVSI